MHRKAFKMKLKPGFSEEYKRRHSQIWPELQTLLRQAGIRDYTIFLSTLKPIRSLPFRKP